MMLRRGPSAAISRVDFGVFTDGLKAVPFKAVTDARSVCVKTVPPLRGSAQFPTSPGAYAPG